MEVNSAEMISKFHKSNPLATPSFHHIEELMLRYDQNHIQMLGIAVQKTGGHSVVNRYDRNTLERCYRRGGSSQCLYLPL